MNVTTLTVGTTASMIFVNERRETGYGDTQIFHVKNKSATATIYLGSATVTSLKHVHSIGPSSEKSMLVENGMGDVHAVSSEAATEVEVAAGLGELR